MDKQINKAEVVKSLIHTIEEKRSLNTIKTKHIDKLDNPEKICLNDENQVYVPDIEAVYDEATTLYEIELDNKMPIEKWRLFSLYSRKKNGSFYLVVPDFLKDNIKKVIKDKEINAGLMFFPT